MDEEIVQTVGYGSRQELPLIFSVSQSRQCNAGLSATGSKSIPSPPTAWSPESRQSSDYPAICSPTDGRRYSPTSRQGRRYIPGWGHSPRRRPALVRSPFGRATAAGWAPTVRQGTGRSEPYRVRGARPGSTRTGVRNRTSVHAQGDPRWSTPVHSSNHALEPALPCRLGRRMSSGEAAEEKGVIGQPVPAHRRRRQHRFHTVRFGPWDFHRHHVLRETPPSPIEGGDCEHGAGSGFSWSVVSSSSLWSSGSCDCRATVRGCAPRRFWKRRGRSYPTICRTDKRSCPRRDAA